MTLKWIRARLTYANVMATVAVFLALGGGAYALTGVPDSGGVYHGCVDPKTSVLRVVKAASSCRKTKTVTRGKRRVRIPGETAIAWNQQGPRGFQGTQGLKGDKGATGSATTLFAAVGSGGSLAFGQGVTGSVRNGLGDYTVTSNRDLTNCVELGTLGLTKPSGGGYVDLESIYTNVHPADATKLDVRTGQKGAAADMAFEIAVFC